MQTWKQNHNHKENPQLPDKLYVCVYVTELWKFFQEICRLFSLSHWWLYEGVCIYKAFSFPLTFQPFWQLSLLAGCQPVQIYQKHSHGRHRRSKLTLWILTHDNTFIKPPKTCHGTCFDCFPVIWSSIRTCIVNLLYWKELIKTNFCFWCRSKRNHITRLHLITLYVAVIVSSTNYFSTGCNIYYIL